MNVHSIIQVKGGKAKSLFCGADASKAKDKFDASSEGLVFWYRMDQRGGKLFKRVDHEANRKQAEAAEKAAKVRAEQEEREAEAEREAAAADLERATARALAAGVIPAEEQEQPEDEPEDLSAVNSDSDDASGEGDVSSPEFAAETADDSTDEALPEEGSGDSDPDEQGELIE